jgi:hypothetical protein
LVNQDLEVVLDKVDNWDLGDLLVHKDLQAPPDLQELKDHQEHQAK